LGVTPSQARSLRQYDRRNKGLVWLVRNTTVVFAERAIRNLALDLHRNVIPAVRAILAARAKAKARFSRKLAACKPSLMR
jgi:hypothetical protein